jgi:hypothetical protein
LYNRLDGPDEIFTIEPLNTGLGLLRGVAYAKLEENPHLQSRNLQPHNFISSSLDVNHVQTSSPMAHSWPSSTSFDGYFENENPSLPNGTSLADTKSSIKDMDDFFLIVRNCSSSNIAQISNTLYTLQQMADNDHDNQFVPYGIYY